MIFGLGFFILAISVVLPLFFSRIFIAAERYSYFTYIGFFFIISIVLNDSLNTGSRLYKSRYMLIGFVSILMIYNIITTVQRTKVWKDTFVLLTNVITESHNQNAVSSALFYRGNYKDMAHDFESAMSDYTLAITLNPKYTIAYNNRGIVKGILNDFQGAKADFNKAIELKADYADAVYNRGLAYYQLNLADSACSDWKKAHSMGFPKAKEMISRYCP